MLGKFDSWRCKIHDWDMMHKEAFWMHDRLGIGALDMVGLGHGGQRYPAVYEICCF